ncbi:SIS domain-containing protein [Xylaria nigripes]|nr:SIS domain-containing protein [Xylaria nigripes]
MMVEHHPVQNSEVFLLGLASRPSVPPPSPPSPLTPADAGPGTPIEQLCLGQTVLSEDDSEASSAAGRRVAGAIHVLNTEATALRSLTQFYKTDGTAAEGFNAAVDAIVRRCNEKGKLVITGVGKSGHIGKKLVATFNSLGLHSTFLHPTEALHGDLGKIGKHDAVLFITFSGKTPELLALLPHVDPALPAIVLTAHLKPTDCELIQKRPNAILLPAPIHESETISFGISAPTTSTTVALALGDALAVVVSQELHTCVSSVFARNHPGGAIGASLKRPCVVREIAVPIGEVTPVPGAITDLTGADILKAGYESPSGWVSVGDNLACPIRIRQLDTSLISHKVTNIPGLLTPRSEWVSISAETRISHAASWIRDTLIAPDCDEIVCSEDSILAIVDGEGDVNGVLEARELLRWSD